MKHQFTITIDTDDGHAAALVRERVVGMIEDMVESERPPFNIECGSLTDTEGELDKLYIEAARDQYGEEGACEIDDNAVVSHGSDPGAYVQAWVWVEETGTLRAAREALELKERQVADGVESEGGTCD
jgi:hypothetical protein